MGIKAYAKRVGKQLEDSKKHLVVSVDNSCVQTAKPKDSNNCAFARAVMKNDSAVRAAYFYRTTAWVEYENRLVRYSLPMSVQKEIVAFDRFRTMEPGVYRLSACEPKATSTG